MKENIENKTIRQILADALNEIQRKYGVRVAKVDASWVSTLDGKANVSYIEIEADL